MKIAIVGTGIAGMTAAYRLHREHDLTIFEANNYYGGHTATVDVALSGQQYAVDTGFIVFNDWTYPNFSALIDELGVPWQNSNMSFSLLCERSGIEYNGTSVKSLFAQRRNAIRPSFLRMVADILRFNANARKLLATGDDRLTLGEYLSREGFSRVFIERYIVPMGMAIWSSSEATMLGFPARFFVEFFDKHGFLNVNHRPVWPTIRGGSREYAKKLTAPFRERIRLSTPVTSVRRHAGGVTVHSATGGLESFDAVLFACHSDQALKLLADPSAVERDILSAFPYQANDAVLHTDTSLLPRRPLARAAWNYFLSATNRHDVALTYDMSVLQNIAAPETFLVTLNRSAAIDPEKVLGRFRYEHPIYSPRAVAAQKRRSEISGVNRSYYCGAYWRYGFHEDGVVSADWAVADLQRAAANIRRTAAA